MSHTEKFRIIGFLDAIWKWHGTWQTTRFRAEDQFIADHIPTQDQIRAYATAKGYWPSGKCGSTLDKCEPVYEFIGQGLDYVNCPICWPAHANPVIDNMAAGPH